MADLIAQGAETTHRWRRTLPTDRTVVLGRSGPWAASWDPLISRRHAELRLADGCLDVCKLDDAKNAIFFRGAEADQFLQFQR